ncbi:MAG TPA: HAMP domain-containing sensor histidine kinase [Chryseolinea sp.]|nr:HAMP domain-containing sensor histidine kinase [Chryseolinea sp.]
MNLARIYRVALGLVLILGIFIAELSWKFHGVLYLISAIYILIFSTNRKQSYVLAVATSLCIIAGYFRSSEYETFSSANIITLAIVLSTVWICLYANEKLQRLQQGRKHDADLLKSLTTQKDQAIQQLQIATGNLMQQVDKRKIAEQELLKRKKLQDAMAHNFPNGVICVLNADMKFILADGGEMEDLGLSKNNKKIDNAIFNLSAVDELKNAFKGEHVSTEFRMNSKSYTLNGVPIADANNEINEVLVVIRNITDQKNLENNLIKALEREKELNVLKSQFVTMASHKFRTPLSTILSSVFLLENYTDADYELEKTAFFDKIKRSVHNLTALLNDYLSLGKLEEGKLKVTYTSTDIKVFFDEFLQEIGSIKKVKQKIHFSHEGIDCTVMTDKFLLKNILTNLLSNAIEYSPHDAEIQLSAELKKDTLKIRVTDQGIGIPENEQHQIFKRFYRGQNANNVEGTGLGLNIAKKYIRLLKGTIEFTSQLNKGTTFIAIIPVMNVNVLEKQA